MIRISRGGDTNGDTLGDGAGFFLDPTPFDSSEFRGSFFNAFVGQAHAGSPADGLSDLFSTVLHEVGHVVGLSSNSDIRLNTTGMTTNTGVPHPPGFLWVFEGPSVTHLFTSNNAGLQDFGALVHVPDPAQSVAWNGQTLQGAMHLMNAGGGPSTRSLIPNGLAIVFHDAFNYEIVMPETFGTFHALLNQTTGELLVRGGVDVSHDVIALRVVGDRLQVSVDVSNDVLGMGPTDAFISDFDLNSVTSIRIEAGDGNDLVLIDSVAAGMPVTIEAGAGNDAIHVGGAGGGGRHRQSPDRHRRGRLRRLDRERAGLRFRRHLHHRSTVSLPNSKGTIVEDYDTVEVLVLLTGDGNDTVNIESTFLGVWPRHPGTGPYGAGGEHSQRRRRRPGHGGSRGHRNRRRPSRHRQPLRQHGPLDRHLHDHRGDGGPRRIQSAELPGGGKPGPARPKRGQHGERELDGGRHGDDRQRLRGADTINLANGILDVLPGAVVVQGQGDSDLVVLRTRAWPATTRTPSRPRP